MEPAATNAVYSPNSQDGPRAAAELGADPSWFTSGDIGRSDAARHPEDSDTGQATTFWRDVLDDRGRADLVDNVVDHLNNGVESHVQQRAVDYWSMVDAEFGSRVNDRLGHLPTTGD
jgi:catalase